MYLLSQVGDSTWAVFKWDQGTISGRAKLEHGHWLLAKKVHGKWLTKGRMTGKALGACAVGALRLLLWH